MTENSIKSFKESRISLVNRNKLTITGVEKVIAVSETSVVLIVYGSELSVAGSGMQVIKLDVESGIFDVEGMIDAIKYSKPKEKLSLKRIFK